MAVHNRDVAEIFNEIADLLDIEGKNQFRIRSYRNAARTLSDLSGNVSEMVDRGEDLSELPGIGEDLAAKIREIVETGSLEQLEKLRKRTSPQLRDLMSIGSLGPKRVKQLHEELGIESAENLEEAARAGRIREIKGFGEKIEQSILRDVGKVKEGAGERRFRWSEMEEYAEPLVGYLGELEEIDRITVAGSYRRRKETVGDLDILVTCSHSAPVMERFTSYEEVEQVLSEGDTRSSISLRSGIQVDLQVVAAKSYGAAMHYFTGSKAHNVAVRKIGRKKKLKINEYGVFKGKKRVAGATEEEVFEQAGLPYIEPELRENRGEIEAAAEGKLPKLVSLEDIRGDLQMHTTASDGKFSIREMAEAARDRGYDYLAVTDHSKRVTMAKGLDAERLGRQVEEIRQLNEKIRGIRILASCEVDILEDGSLDLEDSILDELDLVICSVHYNTNLSEKEQTERIIRAMDNPHFNILAHPTGRLIGSREAYAVDLERVMRAAVERGCFLEINADPERLDLSDVHCKMAKEMGLKIPISTDAHSTSGLDHMRFGVAQARRGWLSAEDVLNTRSWGELKKLLKRG
ncbi:MAG: DNA polymerase/3'-5' exonuclease PolX [Spirochaetales bacterium]|nr:DNA polymerase/3'-5' exonuclease PolX [Spirochaetales bacterium]